MRAVELTVLSFESTLDLGGYQPWTLDQGAENLVPLMNAANAPLPGDPKPIGPQFTYVADQVSGPWQIVIKLEGDTLGVAAYGSSTSQPLEKSYPPEIAGTVR